MPFPTQVLRHIFSDAFREGQHTNEPSGNPFNWSVVSVYVVSLGWAAETEKMGPNYSSVEM